MNQKYRAPQPTNRGFLKPPAYPFGAREVFGKLRQMLAANYNRPMSSERLAKLIGKSPSTTHFWFQVFAHPHILGFLCLLERLSSEQRQSFLNHFCRTLPTLDHPCLRLSSTNSARLLYLLKKPRGLTLISGTDPARAFVLAAFGHTSIQKRLTSDPAGIDLQRPANLVPVETLHYVDPFKPSSEVRTLANLAWVRVVTSNATLVLLNGVWSKVPELRKSVIGLAMFKHVILADHEIPTEADYASLPTQIDTLVVSQAKGPEIRIQLE